MRLYACMYAWMDGCEHIRYAYLYTNIPLIYACNSAPTIYILTFTCLYTSTYSSMCTTKYTYIHLPQDLAGMAILCCDKTGTLTLNKMVIQAETSLYTPDLDQTTLLRYAAVSIYDVWCLYMWYDVCKV